MKKTTSILVSLILLVSAGLAAQTKAPKPGANPVVVFDTDKGQIEIELLMKQAPKGAAHILDLVKKGFYRGLRVHRVTGTVAQWGDPQTRNVRLKNAWGTGNNGTPIGVVEITGMMKHIRGAVGLAYSGEAKFADSQIYIVKTASSGLDGDYSIIGRVTSGMAVVERLQVEDVIKNAFVKGEGPK
jgi:cyclophilin family peptidyl-prolyl cis-trans isomerase